MTGNQSTQRSGSTRAARQTLGQFLARWALRSVTLSYIDHNEHERGWFVASMWVGVLHVPPPLEFEYDPQDFGWSLSQMHGQTGEFDVITT